MLFIFLTKRGAMQEPGNCFKYIIDHFQHLPIYEGYDNHYQHQGGDEHRGVGGVAGSVRDIKEQIQ